MSCLFKKESLEVIGFVRRFCLEASFMKPEEGPLVGFIGISFVLGDRIIYFIDVVGKFSRHENLKFLLRWFQFCFYTILVGHLPS
jgi:hypothetical protein